MSSDRFYERQWFAYVSPLIEWTYAAGILAAHLGGLTTLLSLRQWDAQSLVAALRCRWRGGGGEEGGAEGEVAGDQQRWICCCSFF